MHLDLSCGPCWSVRVARQKGKHNCQERVEVDQSTNNKEHLVVFGRKCMKVGVGQSDMANNILSRYNF